MPEVTEIEKLTKVFTDKLDQLSQDVTGKAVSAAKESVKEWANEAMKSRKFNPGMGTEESDSPWHIKGYNNTLPLEKQAPAVKEAFYSVAGNYIKAVYCAQHGINNELTKALGVTTGSSGGFLVPVEFRPELLKLIIEDQLVRPRARIVPMATDTLWWPKIVDTTHASTIHGGMKATATAEAGSLGTGDPTVGQMRLVAKKYTSSWKVSNELLMDSPISIMPLLGELGREAVGFDEDYDAITGNGAERLFGFLNSGALISTTRNVTGDLAWKDITNMYGKMFPSSLKRAVWACSPGVLTSLFNMVVPAGTGGSAVFVSNVQGQTGADAPPMTILGRPLIVSEKLPALGTVGDLVFCDFSYYIIGDRMDLKVDASEHVYFANDQTALRMIERVDGQPWLDSALTARNGTDTISAFVACAT